MKYRRLSKAELTELKTEFVQFLAANTVTGADWEKIKAESPERMEGLIDLFSDLVYEQTLDKLQYLEHRTQTELRCFHCLPDKIVMLGLVAKDCPNFNFQDHLPSSEMMSKIKEEGGSIQFFSAEKEYKQDRKAELFKMLENGCLISKGQLYQTLKSIQPS